MTKSNETLNAIAQTVITMMNEQGHKWTKPWNMQLEYTVNQ